MWKKLILNSIDLQTVYKEFGQYKNKIFIIIFFYDSIINTYDIIMYNI